MAEFPTELRTTQGGLALEELVIDEMVKASQGVGLTALVRCASYSARRATHDRGEANQDTATDEDVRSKPAGL